jgi:hypothetical protein
MNGYVNEETYFFALHFLDDIQEVHLENKFENYQELENYCNDMIEELDTSENWFHDIIQHELQKVDFMDLFNKLENE